MIHKHIQTTVLAISALLFCGIPAAAQERKVTIHIGEVLGTERPIERDTTRAEIFSSFYSAGLLLNIYGHMVADTTIVSNSEAREARFSTGYYQPSALRVGAPTREYPEINIAGLGGMRSSMYENWDIDNPHFPKKMAWELRWGNREYMRQYGKHTAAERHSLTQYLRELSADEELPLIFADIYRSYGGNIERYVNDLYDRSILTSHKRLNRFCRHPRVKTFASDPGVRFVVSMELYRNAQKLKALRAARGSGE